MSINQLRESKAGSAARQPITQKLCGARPAANDALLLPVRVGMVEEQGFCVRTLVLVVLAHGSLIAALLYWSSEPLNEPPQALPAAMMVSLVSHPALEQKPEPAEVNTPSEIKALPQLLKKVPEAVQQAVKPQSVRPQQEQPLAEAEPAAVDQSMVAATEPRLALQQAAAIEQAVKQAPEQPDAVEPPRFGAAYLHNPPPRYPLVSRRMGEEGHVMLRVLVSIEGKAESVEIESGSGSARLDKAAVEAVEKWQFIPAKRDREPVSAYVIVPIRFTLNG